MKKLRWCVVCAVVAAVMFIPGCSRDSANVSPPQNLLVPPLAFDPYSIVITWEKPADYYAKERANSKKRIVDYQVWQNNAPLRDLSSDNFAQHYTYLNVWNKAFYEGTKADDHYKLTYLSYTLSGLDPDTEYTLKVRAKYADGTWSGFSEELRVSTIPEYAGVIEVDPATPGILTITDKTDNDNRYITKDAGGDAAAKAAITASTAALQTALDSIPYKGKIVLKGTGDNASPVYYISGALFLHGNMTFEIEAGAVLLGSPVFDNYQRNLLLYSYSTDIRSQGLINAITWDYGTLENIRLCGEGMVDGNGWNLVGNGAQEAVELDPNHPAVAAVQKGVDPTNGAGAGQWKLPNMFAGTRNSVSANGILAADSMDKANADLVPNQGGENSPQHYNTRPQLAIFRGVKGVCIDGLTFTNPAFHGIVFYHSEYITSVGTKVMSFNANNGDGIEFGDSLNFYLLNNFYDAGDDAVNFAAGQGNVTRNYSDIPASGMGRIVNNYVRNGHGGLASAGSHTGGWIGDIMVEDNLFKGSERGGAGVIRLKSAGTTGGGARNITFRDSAVYHQTSSAPVIQIDRNYVDANASTEFAPESEVPVVYENINMRNVTISGVSANALIGCTEPVLARQGYKMVARDFHVEDVRVFSSGDNGSKIALKDVSDSSFKNIRYAGNVDGYVNLIDCRNITVQNITGSSGAQENIIPKNLDWPAGNELKLSADGNKVTANWKLLSGADGGYTILVQDDSGLCRYFVERAEVEAGVDSWTGYLSPDTQYTVAVQAKAQAVAGNTSVSTEYLTASIATGEQKAARGTAILPESTIIREASNSGISWINLNWDNASPGDNGIQYYKIMAAETENGATTEYRCYYQSRWAPASPLGHSGRSGYALAELSDRAEYTAILTVIDWAGEESEPYQPLVFTTVPGTLMELPKWESGSILSAIMEEDGSVLHLSWDAADVTDYSQNDEYDRFAGYRILVNGIPLSAHSAAGEVLNQVNAVPNTTDTKFDLDLRGYPPGFYAIAVEAGNEILKFASGSGGLEGATPFTGTRNTREVRNNVTFGKWTGHGPQVIIELAE